MPLSQYSMKHKMMLGQHSMKYSMYGIKVSFYPVSII